MFSFNCSLFKHTDFDELIGTELYYPPEFFTHKRYNGEDLDLWGAALVLYEMVEGVMAFETTEEIAHKKLVFRKESSAMFRFFIKLALHKNRKCRLNKRTIWDHKWF